MKRPCCARLLLSSGSAAPRTPSNIKLERLEPTCGGEPLLEVVVTKDLFRASAMHAEAPVAFEEMKVADLKAELVARGAARSRAKGVLHQSRLHALIVQSAVERARGGVEEDDI